MVATIKTFLEMKNRSPDVLLAMEVMHLLSCIILSIIKKTYILHESNVVPGETVSFLSSKVE